MLVGSSVSRINRLNIHESSSFVLNDISYRLIIAQKQEMKACLFAFYLFLTIGIFNLKRELTSMLQWIRNRYWSDCYLFFSTKVSNFCVCLGHFPSHRLFWLVLYIGFFIFPKLFNYGACIYYYV